MLTRQTSFWFWIAGTAATLARVNARLLCIKPPHCITRLPRSLCERSYWKASEWRHWLLFYMLPCLQGILPVDYWKLLAKLCEAVHILLRDSIALHEIQQAGKLALRNKNKISKTIYFWFGRLLCYQSWNANKSVTADRSYESGDNNRGDVHMHCNSCHVMSIFHSILSH